jgi:ATP-dependent RNA helicase DDX3X
LLLNTQLAKYSVPTPVQKHALTVGNSGRDLMACAQTGSGKTAGFLLPTINRMMTMDLPPIPESNGSGRSRSKRYPYALVLSPTRELTTQIYNEAVKFTYRTGCRPVVVYGGAPIRDQLGEIEKGCEMIVATPGRLVDMIERGKLSMACIS